MFPPANPSPNNPQEVQRWMEATAKNQRPTKKLIFDKLSKRIIAVNVNDPRGDQSMEFTPKEATRFYEHQQNKYHISTQDERAGQVRHEAATIV